MDTLDTQCITEASLYIGTVGGPTVEVTTTPATCDAAGTPEELSLAQCENVRLDAELRASEAAFLRFKSLTEAALKQKEDGTTEKRTVGQHSLTFRNPVEVHRTFQLADDNISARKKAAAAKSAKLQGYEKPDPNSPIFRNINVDPGNGYVRSKTLAFTNQAVDFAMDLDQTSTSPRDQLAQIKAARTIGG